MVPAGGFERRPTDWTPLRRAVRCGQESMEIDNRGERLMGCLTCNLWAVLIVRGGQGLAKRTSAPSISYAERIMTDDRPLGRHG
jgi:hypothetical protein